MLYKTATIHYIVLCLYYTPPPQASLTLVPSEQHHGGPPENEDLSQSARPAPAGSRALSGSAAREKGGLVEIRCLLWGIPDINMHMWELSCSLEFRLISFLGQRYRCTFKSSNTVYTHCQEPILFHLICLIWKL